MNALLKRSERLHYALPIHPLAVIGIHVECFSWNRWNLPALASTPRRLYLREPGFAYDKSEIARQQQHLNRIKALGKDRSTFHGANDLILKLWNALVRIGLLRDDPPVRQPNNLPFGSIGDSFKGRQSELDLLHTRLRRDVAPIRPQALHGLAGVGKSPLAIEYAWLHRHEFTALLFVSSSTPENLDASLAALSAASILDLPEQRSHVEGEQRDAVLRWLQSNEGWLLILDNVDTKNARPNVQSLLARIPSGQTIVTSQITQWGKSMQMLPLDVLDKSDAVQLLLESTVGRRSSRDDEQIVSKVAARLGCLPLALTHAAAFVDYKGIDYATYLEIFESKFSEILEWHDHAVIEYDTTPARTASLKTISSTFFLAFDQLGPVEKTLLRAASFLAPQPIPWSCSRRPAIGSRSWCTSGATSRGNPPARSRSRTPLRS